MACISPIGLKNPKKLKNRHYVAKNAPEPFWTQVPCGKCPACLKSKANAWAFRLNQHQKIAGSALFITLTYDSDHVPMSKNGFMTLRKKDYQDFMKRLRHAHPKGSHIKYYAVGEYGTKTQRPHFHAIIFGVQATENDYQVITKAWSKYVCDIQTKEHIHLPIGGVYVGSVQDASINYTTKYLHKGQSVPKHRRDDREKESSLSSMKLGANYLSDDMVKWHNDDITRNYIVHPDGWKSALPRYYRDKIFDGYTRLRQKPIMEKLILDREKLRKEQYILRTGSPGGYDLSKLESNKAYFYNFSKHEKEQRTTI